jgi:hypothetical protein
MSLNTNKNEQHEAIHLYPFLISISFLLDERIVRINGEYPSLKFAVYGKGRLSTTELVIVHSMLQRISNRLRNQQSSILGSTSRKGSHVIEIGKTLNPDISELGGEQPLSYEGPLR